MVLAFVAAAAGGWVARGATLHSADASPIVRRAPASCPNPAAVAIAAAVLTPDPPAADEDADDTPDPDDESAGDDIGDLLAKANAATETHNGVHGVVTDQTSGTLRGVTVVLVHPGGGAQTTITDEEGEYAFADLEAGTYTVSFYYVNVVSEHPNVTINSFDSATLSDRLDTSDYRDRDDDQYVFETE
ncbi:MAG: carboxypeptidase-like regulatory domain-containing protein [Kofleriaceae bacterium]